MTPPYICKFCGATSRIDPSDQIPPPDYCHESDHGSIEDEMFKAADRFQEDFALLVRSYCRMFEDDSHFQYLLQERAKVFSPFVWSKRFDLFEQATDGGPNLDYQGG